MEDEWRVRLNEVVRDDGRSLRALSLAAGFGENYVQQMLKDKKDPSFTKLAKVLAVLGPTATFYVTSGLRPDPERQLRSMLLAFGVDGDELDQVMRVIRTYVSADAKSEQSPDEVQTPPANPRRARERLE